MKAFYDCRQKGELTKFVMRADVSEITPSTSMKLTQILFVQPSSTTTATTEAKEDVDQLEEKNAVFRSSLQTTVDLAEPTVPDSSSCGTVFAPENTENAQFEPIDGSAEAPISFASPPRVSGPSKREKLRLAGRKELTAARELVMKLKGDWMMPLFLLEQAYSLDLAKAVIDALDLLDVEVQGSLTVRPFNVGQQVPQICATPQLNKLYEAIQSIKATDNLNLLAHWNDFGFATFGQLEALANVQEARNRFQLVQLTLDWIEGVEWQIEDVVSPFTDCCDITKLLSSYLEYQNAIRHMTLGQIRLDPEWCLGCSLMDYRKIFALKQMYTTKKKTAAGFGAMDPYSDPLVMRKTNFSVLKSSVQLAIEPTVGMEGQITYQGITWCTQQDGNSCGIWCLVFWELLLPGRPWTNSLYDLLSYLRMRYLLKTIGVQRCDVDEGYEQDE
ncbi:hypothetical protein GN244_ATG14950 [Phytophthora infestans]|uniref:Ubiquitin-like protease family profile domain-containing protein n=1 Tax=Phytophthora infestans TaxID=4787 RepID=A0A833W8R9_PHYIN|nr:hypothetical protein GN244_ATG14950 [Phytophthora infestans]